MESLKIGNDHFVYEVRVGTVQKIESRTETKVSGGGGGGSTFNGTGASSGVYISSTSIHHQTIYMMDKDGKEFSVTVENFNISAIEGQVLAAARVESMYHRGYAVIYNCNMETAYSGNTRKFFRPSNSEEGSGILKIGALAALGIPAFFYGQTNSNIVGFVTFLLTAGAVGLFYRNFKRTQSNGDLGAVRLRQTLTDILKRIDKNISRHITAV